MGEMDSQENFVKALQARYEKKLKDNEIELLEYWKAHLDKLASLKPDGIGSLQLQIKKVAEMMKNRIMVLKRE
ncbi:MAG: hypothetical protein CSYNP_04406 [Syntrophus sp. SKADARSKE-3]|nr:hypothetical protein [Syntrophus sp. SKADARSKE-3]